MKIKLIIILGIFFLISGFNYSLAVEIMPISQVKKGMIGYGKTVLKGNKITTFKIKVIDILPNFEPKSDLIIVKLTDKYFKKIGVITGMSGSPIYIDNKIVGALAYAWSFAKEPIAGVTPIKPMLKNESLPTSFAISKTKNLKKYTDYKEFNLIKTPLLINGLSESFLPFLQEQLSFYNFTVIKGGGYNKIKTKLTAEEINNLDLAGQSIAVPLARGDVNLSAVGTLTEVFPDKIVALGHPFFGLGKTNLPLHLAKIKTVIPLMTSSFKIGSLDKEIGKITFDGFYGISGKLNSFVKMLPLTCSIKLNKNITKNFSYEVANIPFLTPIFINLLINNSLEVVFKKSGVTSLKYKIILTFADHSKIVYEDWVVATNIGQTLESFASLISLFYNQEIEKKKIKEINTYFHPASTIKQASIIAISLDKKSYKPGDLAKLAVYFKPFGQKELKKNINFKLPENLLESDYTFFVADANTFFSKEANRKSMVPPKNFNSLKKLLKLKGKSNQLVISLYLPQNGLNILDEELTFLPSSMLEIYENLFPLPEKEIINNTNIYNKRINTPWILTNYNLVIPLKIEADK